jgi:hypothetical protein
VNDSKDLTAVLAEWRRLAEAQGEGIRAGNWSFVAECEKTIARLQSSSHHLRQRANPAGVPSKPSHRSTVLDLIALQQRNLATLQQRREILSNQIENLTRTSRNLRGIQRSYSPPGSTGWSSYS